MPKKIEVVDSSPDPTLLDRHILEQRPLVIRGCYRGQPLGRWAGMTHHDAQAAAVEALGDTPLRIVEEYTSVLLSSPRELNAKVPLGTWPLGRYLDYIARNPYSRRMCSEMLTPACLLELFEPPACARPQGEWISKTFIGNAGNYAHLHFDYDFRQVLLYQAFGRKRVVVIPIAEAWKLMPIINFSSFFLEDFREDEKTRFLDYAGAWECMLEPGDALFMPALCWHYLEYPETSMSIALRFGRSRHNQLLKERFPAHMTVEMQRIGGCLIDDRVAAGRWSREHAEMMEAAGRPYASGAEQYRALQELFRELGARMCPESFVRRAWMGDAEKLQEDYIASHYEPAPGLTPESAARPNGTAAAV